MLATTAIRLRLLVAGLMLSAASMLIACGGGAPCDKAVDKQIALGESQGSAAEKATAAKAKFVKGGREGLIAVCSELASDSEVFAARVTCQAGAATLVALKACVNAPAPVPAPAAK